MEVGTRRHFVLAFTFILNAIDGVLTVAWIVSGKAEEANPIMDHLLDVDPTVFMAVKLVLVALGSVLLWKLRHRRGAVISIFALFLIYYAVLVYHANALAEHFFPGETIEEALPPPGKLRL